MCLMLMKFEIIFFQTSLGSFLFYKTKNLQNIVLLDPQAGGPDKKAPQRHEEKHRSRFRCVIFATLAIKLNPKFILTFFLTCSLLLDCSINFGWFYLF